jgi:hypothetical protein
MSHFVNCIANDEQRLETGEDGKAALENIFAAHESAATGRKVALPFTPPSWAHSPIHCWKLWLSPDRPPGLMGERP